MSVQKFSYLIRKSPKSRASLQAFYNNFVKILRNEFDAEIFLVDTFIFWVLFFGTISMIFFNHYCLYLISSYLMVITFPQLFKPSRKYVPFDFTSSAIALLKLWYVQSHNTISWTLYSEVLFRGHNITTTTVLNPS